LIREARLRAGLTQDELGERVGRNRSHIARWERDAVAPSFETLQEVLRACGWELSTTLQPYDPAELDSIKPLRRLTPSERLTRMLGRPGKDRPR
jgi:transcriptional regulator with XRE-family HTH domain